MSTFTAWRDGVVRVGRAPWLLLLLWLCSVVVSLPPALALHAAIASHLGNSLEADRAADGVNATWMQEFTASSDALGRTLRSDTIGFAAVLDQTSALADNRSVVAPVAIAGIGYLALVWFLTPGIIGRLAEATPGTAARLLARCGAHTARFVRLAIVSAIVYGVLFGSLHALLFDDLFDSVTHDITVERTAFMIRVGCYVVFFLVVAAANLVFDFAKIRMVVEDRHSVLSSLAASVAFVARRPALAIGVYACNVALLAIVLAIYFIIAPGALSSGVAVWVGFAVSQIYVAARLFTKLAFWGSEVCALQKHFGCSGIVRG
ncbi:MAG: hypothetical protein QM736_23425 [Vicinamibacterales bacterium]